MRVRGGGGEDTFSFKKLILNKFLLCTRKFTYTDAPDPQKNPVRWVPGCRRHCFTHGKREARRGEAAGARLEHRQAGSRAGGCLAEARRREGPGSTASERSTRKLTRRGQGWEGSWRPREEVTLILGWVSGAALGRVVSGRIFLRLRW